MNRTMIFAALGALGMALVVAMLLSAGSGDKKTPDTEILVASKDLSIGSKLDSNTTNWQKWPKGSSIPGALVRDKIKEDEWKDQKIRRTITKGEPITEGALVKEVKGSYLAAALEPGMRAISIDIKPANGVSGFLTPGDRVDVILTYQTHVSQQDQGAIITGPGEGVMERASETIVENVRVLATDQDSSGDAESERKAKISKTLTIEVTPKQAEKLALGIQMGDLYFVLRQLGDTKQMSTTEKATTDYTTATILRKAAGNVGGSTNTIHVYTANGVQEVKVTGSKQ
jgi:pilus assembly protein CpaB